MTTTGTSAGGRSDSESAADSGDGAPRISRRGALRGLGAAALAGGALGGAATGVSAQSGDVESWLSDTSNFDGVVDRTGQSSVTVEVGVEANGGAFGFGPAAIRVSPGTTVTWEWTGNGSAHNVVDADGAFESELTDAAGHTFEHTFSETGTYTYSCTPHETLGMKGAVIVERGGGGSGDGGQNIDPGAGGLLLAGAFGVALASPGLFGAFLWLTGRDGDGRDPAPGRR